MRIVLFGESPDKSIEMISVIHSIDKNIEIHDALNEEQGWKLLKSISDIDIVLIGSNYNLSERERIFDYVEAFMPYTLVTQPGYDYPYSYDLIKREIAFYHIN
jgi:hypothetical protein